jgi:hypothetical protein
MWVRHYDGRTNWTSCVHFALIGRFVVIIQLMWMAFIARHPEQNLTIILKRGETKLMQKRERERMLLALKSTKHYIRKSIFSPTELQFTLNFVQLLGGGFNIFEVLRSSIFIISQLLKSRIIGF